MADQTKYNKIILLTNCCNKLISSQKNITYYNRLNQFPTKTALEDLLSSDSVWTHVNISVRVTKKKKRVNK